MMIANGERLQSAGICKAVCLLIGDEQLWVDLFFLHISGFDIVLGVNWLRSLGPILWDFSALTMTFPCRERRVVINGQPEPAPTHPHIRTLQSRDDRVGKLDRLLREFKDIFS